MTVRYCEAWSETKKKWCCRKYGKGCEGSSPPAVDPGDGKTWAHQKAIHCTRWNLNCFETLSLHTNSPAGPRRDDLGGEEGAVRICQDGCEVLGPWQCERIGIAMHETKR